jgi:hypothetical protein
MPEDLRTHGKTDHRYFGPDAQFRYQREAEAPREDEGFAAIERRAFVRRNAAAGSRRAVFFDPLHSDPLDDVLRNYEAEGFLPIGIAWRPGGGAPLQLKYPYFECVHVAGPPICWCRKPLPGLVLQAVAQFDIDLRTSILIGDTAADRTMAGRLGLASRDAKVKK